jgi:hypothetical protein
MNGRNAVEAVYDKKKMKMNIGFLQEAWRREKKHRKVCFCIVGAIFASLSFPGTVQEI